MNPVQSANLATYLCSAFTALILILRLLLTFRKTSGFDLSFAVAVAALIAVIVRIPVTYYLIQYGTVSDYLTIRKKNPDLHIDQERVEKYRSGSRLSLVARILLTTCLWLMITLLLLLYRRFLSHLPWMRNALRAAWVFIGATYIAVFLTTFLECRPFPRYWQISPDPGSCVKAYAQLTVQCVSNIILDLLVMGIAIPMLFIAGKQRSYQVRIGALISLGVIAVIVSCLRVTYTFKEGSLQSTRTLWASISILAAAFVANAPVLYGSLRSLLARKGPGRNGSTELDTVDSETLNRHTKPVVPKKEEMSEELYHELAPKTTSDGFETAEKRHAIYGGELNQV